MRKNKKAFTLIELIAVLVILAIIALIATPLVTSIIKKAKDSANKRSIDAYGKAAELAVTTYLLDTGDYPRDFNSLTIEYNGNEVVCNTKTLNEDGSIYLSGCSVNGVEVKDSSNDDGYYHYGKIMGSYEVYNMGDIVTYNGINFYVIADSDSNSDSVTLLKETPLTVDEVNTYGGVGTENNIINKYSLNDSDLSPVGTAIDQNGYGAMTFYESESCYYKGRGNFEQTDCVVSYENSTIKKVIDAWSLDKLDMDVVINARLIAFNDLNVIKEENPTSTIYSIAPENSWAFSYGYQYWTMTSSEDSESSIWYIGDGMVSTVNVAGSSTVRPVITLLKSAI